MRRLAFLLVFVSAAAPGVEADRSLLIVATSPPGAAITIDGVLAGLSPRSETLAPGVHTVTAELQGAVVSQTISLVAGEERRLTLSLVHAFPPRPAPIAGLVTLGGGALGFGLGLLLQLPARAAGREVSLLYERGGGWDESARRLEASGLSAQTWSWFFTGAGVAVMAAGLLVTGLQLFGPRTDLPALVFVPTSGGGVLSWGARW
ncbi:MAG: PEGA domain-containing protein [Archangium sp.]|nr:PEGA domain-containing protein [Archangium sp.]